MIPVRRSSPSRRTLHSFSDQFVHALVTVFTESEIDHHSYIRTAEKCLVNDHMTASASRLPGP
jgi:hypothetical protein